MKHRIVVFTALFWLLGWSSPTKAAWTPAPFRRRILRPLLTVPAGRMLAAANTA